MAGKDRRIHYGINLARDLFGLHRKGVTAAESLTLTLLLVFDYMNLTQCLTVLEKKAAASAFIQILSKLQVWNFLFPNSSIGKSSIRHTSVPVHGPTVQHEPHLSPFKQHHKLIGFAYDNKPTIITCLERIGPKY